MEIHEMSNARRHETRFVDASGKEKLLAEEADLPGGGREHPWRWVRTVDDGTQLLQVGADDALAILFSPCKAHARHWHFSGCFHIMNYDHLVSFLGRSA